jgi:hypothetical protein
MIRDYTYVAHPNTRVCGVFMYVCMYVLDMPKRFDEFYLYNVFQSSYITGHCPANMGILSPGTEALRIGPKTKWLFSRQRLA